jgi:hypothetical protein
MEKLKGIREKMALFCGCTLYGSRGLSGAAPAGLKLEEAGGRFQELGERGISFVRLVIAWEALEGSGPGAYDEARLAYLRKLLLAAEQAGIAVFIDPVQNRWSRWIRGDKAPSWVGEQQDKGQEWLQERYFDCMRHCFRRLKNCGALIGWGASAEDISRSFMLGFAGRMREAREGMGFFVAEDPRSPKGPGHSPLGTGDDPEWAGEAFYYYDGAAFPDY